MSFQIHKTDTNTKARAGTLKLAHGDVRTPIFMPVGTVGTVKAIRQSELEQKADADIILGNTYHLYLRPGMETLQSAGGLHPFMSWNRPILTDSGGYQVYSLSQRRKIKEEGVTFSSHIDGSRHLFTPENVMDIQRKIGSDIMMAFDECPPYPSEYRYAKDSMELTHRWLDRCIYRVNETEGLYGFEQELAPIVQGSTFKDLRVASSEFVASKNCNIHAIGGLSVGEPVEEMYMMTELVCGILPEDKPRYLMGVGTPVNILENLALGVDMFDCVMPTRNARHGLIYTAEGIINIKNARWSRDFSVLDGNPGVPDSGRYSKAYLRHLFVAGEILGLQIASLHNISFYLWLVREARTHILEGDFYEWKKQMVKKLATRL
ncbi:MAG TPA: tRNA guanosine(34) transglycosylase Tgt [Saprospirales bacterium]|nr:tRNA guanosine(34) transglycosylase Tgt [Saprospirales bacterium]HAY71050.1 tRNA guanosine(34) transglycosylase Tgt [Saprospirales bacterium]